MACKPGAVEVLLMRLQRFITEVRAGKRQLSDSPEPHGGVPFQAHMAMSGGGSGAAAQHFAAGAGFGPGAATAGTSGALAQGTARSSGGGGGGGMGSSAAAMGGGISGIAGGSGTYGGARSEEEVARATEDAAQAAEKDRKIAELEDMVDILTQKVTKLEQLVRLKDTRIGALSARIVSGGSGGGGWLPARRCAPQRPNLPLSGPASHPPLSPPHTQTRRPRREGTPKVQKGGGANLTELFFSFSSATTAQMVQKELPWSKAASCMGRRPASAAASARLRGCCCAAWGRG